MRNAFIDQLIHEANSNPKIFLLVGDLGFNVVDPFAKAFPDRFLNVGVAEQNMTGIAAGLAMEGYAVFTYSIANFPTLRCLEQIRNDVAYHNLDVTIVSVGGGFSYGPYGMSHHATEDLAIMRAIPNITVCAPGDPWEVRYVVRNILARGGPKYLRLGKGGEPDVHQEMPAVPFGQPLPIVSAGKVAVLTTGAVLSWVKNEMAHLPEMSLYSVPVIKPFPLTELCDICKLHDRLLCIEEHQASGGFGSAVLEAANDLVATGNLGQMPLVRRVAIRDVFLDVAGTQDYLRKLAGLALS
jgi:transketolase